MKNNAEEILARLNVLVESEKLSNDPEVWKMAEQNCIKMFGTKCFGEESCVKIYDKKKVNKIITGKNSVYVIGEIKSKFKVGDYVKCKYIYYGIVRSIKEYESEFIYICDIGERHDVEFQEKDLEEIKK